MTTESLRVPAPGPRRWRRVPVPLRWAAPGVAVLAVLAVLFTGRPAESTTPEGTSVRLVHLAAVGDSITAADAHTRGSGYLVAGRMRDSWVSTAATGDVVLVGGWAHHGATTAQMAAAVRPVHADVLVVLAGTNDTRHHIPFTRSAADLERIVATVGARHVVVSAIPPRDDAPHAVTAYNAQLQALAAQRGWTFTDPMGGIRTGTHYARGDTVDGTHPTPAAAQVIGRALAAAVQRAAIA